MKFIKQPGEDSKNRSYCDTGNFLMPLIFKYFMSFIIMAVLIFENIFTKH